MNRRETETLEAIPAYQCWPIMEARERLIGYGGSLQITQPGMKVLEMCFRRGLSVDTIVERLTSGDKRCNDREGLRNFAQSVRNQLKED